MLSIGGVESRVEYLLRVCAPARLRAAVVALSRHCSSEGMALSPFSTCGRGGRKVVLGAVTNGIYFSFIVL